MHNRILQRFTGIIITLVAFLFSKMALAYPYTLYAKYNGSASKEIKVTFDDNHYLAPANPTDAKFLGVFFKANSDDLAKSEFDRIERIDVDICKSEDCLSDKLAIKHSITLDQLKSSTEVRLIGPNEVYEDGQAASHLHVEVRPRFTAAYLCYIEETIRADQKAITLATIPEDKSAPRTKLPDDKKKFELGKENFDKNAVRVLLPATSDDDLSNNILAYATLFGHGLKSSGQGLIYTFCLPQHDRIDWHAVASIGKPQWVAGDDEAEKAHVYHKHEVAKQVMSAMQKKGISDDVHLEQRVDDKHDDVYGLLRHNLTLLLDISDLHLAESVNSNPIANPSVVDKGSQIVLNVSSKSLFCSEVPGCNTVITDTLGVTTTSPSVAPKTSGTTTNAPNTTSSDSPLTANGNQWVVIPDLSKYVGQKISFAIYFKADGGEKLTMLGPQYSADVENIGVITTFPVVSDVVAAATSNPANPGDISLQSSIPVSWGINLSAHEQAAHAAVTFPWMIGYNSRSNPHLADIVKVFPHVSVIFPLKSDTAIGTPQVALGAGIALANAFTFSLAETIQGEPQTFLLLGISVTDLAKVAKMAN